MLADLACEIKECHVFGPVIVVDHFRTVGGVAVEVEKFRQLFLDRLLIVAQCRLVEQIAFR